MLILNKPIGVTPIDYWKEYRDNVFRNPTLKGCVCGKLDPMARGQLLVLLGDKCKEMPRHLNHRKEYEVDIVLGISTDTQDVLGMWDTPDTSINQLRFIQHLRAYKDITKQRFHPYSAICVTNQTGLRKPLWWWTKNKRLFEVVMPEKTVAVYNLEILKTETINLFDYIENVIEKLRSVRLDHSKFRVDEILGEWMTMRELYRDTRIELPIIKIKIEVSSGFYIRQMLRDIQEATGVFAHCWDINRTNIFWNRAKL